MATDSNIAKKAAGYAAADFIKSGMTVGLGTGSTAFFFIERLGQLCRSGLKIQAIATSRTSQDQAIHEGIPIMDENSVVSLDITVDGADQVDRQMCLIKGGGGALLREKIVASMSREVIIIVDEDKEVKELGHIKLPVEIVPFAYNSTLHKLKVLGYQGTLRLKKDNQPYVTDNHNYIIDVSLDTLNHEPKEMEQELHAIPGVIETGLFIGIANKIIVGDKTGQVKIHE